jgi:pentatricopeptide repeat protein
MHIYRGISPDRRIYKSLIAIFGIKNEVASALGVFDEMRRRFTPDIVICIFIYMYIYM